MKTMAGIALLCVLYAAMPAPARAVEPARPAGKADADFAGHYYLDGVMETGSELLLVPDGRFEWMMVYGALDLTARGSWRREGDRIVLRGEDIAQAPVFRLVEETPTPGTALPPGAWTALVGIPGVRALAGVEVMFEGGNGERGTATADGNGIATLQPHPDGAVWTRTALRRGGRDEPWQWIDMPAAAQASRIAAFTVADPSAYRGQAFETMQLRIDGRDLVPSFPWDAGAESGRYSRE